MIPIIAKIKKLEAEMFIAWENYIEISMQHKRAKRELVKFYTEMQEEIETANIPEIDFTREKRQKQHRHDTKF